MTRRLALWLWLRLPSGGPTHLGDHGRFLRPIGTWWLPIWGGIAISLEDPYRPFDMSSLLTEGGVSAFDAELKRLQIEDELPAEVTEIHRVCQTCGSRVIDSAFQGQIVLSCPVCDKEKGATLR